MTGLNMAEQQLLDLAVRTRALWEDGGIDALHPETGLPVFVTGLCDIWYALAYGLTLAHRDGSTHWKAKYTVFRNWPEFSGDTTYPVRHPNHKDPEYAFGLTGGKTFWTGEYGAARLRLLYFVVDYLTAKAVAP